MDGGRHPTEPPCSVHVVARTVKKGMASDARKVTAIRPVKFSSTKPMQNRPTHNANEPTYRTIASKSQ